MHLGNRWFTWFAAAFVAVLLVSPATAFAGEGDATDEETTTDATTTIVGTTGGKRTIRITTSKDGSFRLLSPEIVTEEVIDESDGESESSVHVVVTGPNGAKQVKTVHLKKGAWISVDGEEPVRLQGRILASEGTPAVVMRGAASGVAVPAGRNPMSTLFTWLMGGAGAPAAGCPFQAWFDGGPDVPLAGLRDALKADGWTAQELGTWVHSNLSSVLMRTPSMPQPRVMARAVAPSRVVVRAAAPCRVHAPRAGQWFHGARPSSCRQHARGHERGCGGGRCGTCAQPQQRERGCVCGHGSRSGWCHPQAAAQAPRRGCGCGQGQAYGRGHCQPPERAPMPRHGCGCGQGQAYGHGRALPSQRAPMPQPGCNCGQRHGRDLAAPRGRRAFAPPRAPLPATGPGPHLRWPDCSGTGRPGAEAPSGTPALPNGIELLYEVLRGQGEPRTEHVETSEGDGTARAIVEGLKLLPPDLLERVPPEVLESVLKEMRGLGLGEILAPPSDCDTCPKRDGCHGKGEEKSSSKGDCDSCPKQGNCTSKDKSSCTGDCDKCPKQGNCDGDCDGNCTGKDKSSCAGDCDECPKQGNCSEGCGGKCKGKTVEADVETPSAK